MKQADRSYRSACFFIISGERLLLRTTRKVENLGSDLGLTGLVVFEGEFLEQVLGVVRGRLHRDGAGGVLCGGRLRCQI